jgi:phage shock protein PspC (stress-responsive transcriptional regulator)
MNKVVTVNLAGSAWQLEEEAYVALQSYLDDASARLASNPDKEEILRDFESAIADLCAERVSGHKNVIELAEMESILAHIGVVEADVDGAPEDAAGASGDIDPNAETVVTDASAKPAKRLYRVRDKEMIAGVCSGMAAYFNVDVTVVRLGWLIGALISGGALILAYIVMVFIVPEAETTLQRAEASGTRLDARELIARARSKAPPALAGFGALLRKLGRMAGKLVVAALTIASLLVVAAWVAALWSTLVDGRIFGFTFDPGTDAWLMRVWITCLAWVVLAPLVALAMGLRRVMNHNARSRANVAVTVGGTAVWVAALVSAFMIAWTSTPKIREKIDSGKGVVTFGRYHFCVNGRGEWDSEREKVDCNRPENVYEDGDIEMPTEPAEPAEPAEPVEPDGPIN